eukprot:1684589-Amphidinium_carterae.1
MMHGRRILVMPKNFRPNAVSTGICWRRCPHPTGSFSFQDVFNEALVQHRPKFTALPNTASRNNNSPYVFIFQSYPTNFNHRDWNASTVVATLGAGSPG